MSAAELLVKVRLMGGMMFPSSCNIVRQLASDILGCRKLKDLMPNLVPCSEEQDGAVMAENKVKWVWPLCPLAAALASHPIQACKAVMLVTVRNTDIVSYLMSESSAHPSLS